jgi:biopolymer transport protein ExbD
MAGNGNAEDNPVSMNVVPMVDVIFCLCVFFMCSFKFKELEGRFKTWLPTDKGNGLVTPEPPEPPEPIGEMRVLLTWDEAQQTTVRHYVTRIVATNEELEAVLAGAHEDDARSGHDVPLIIDADGRVPWNDVASVVNSCKRLGIDKVQFALSGSAPATK